MDQIEQYRKNITGPFGDRVISLIENVSKCDISVPRYIFSIVNDVNGAYHILKTIDEKIVRERLSEVDELIRRYEKNCKCKRI